MSIDGGSGVGSGRHPPQPSRKGRGTVLGHNPDLPSYLSSTPGGTSTARSSRIVYKQLVYDTWSGRRVGVTRHQDIVSSGPSVQTTTSRALHGQSVLSGLDRVCVGVIQVISSLDPSEEPPPQGSRRGTSYKSSNRPTSRSGPFDKSPPLTPFTDSDLSSRDPSATL